MVLLCVLLWALTVFPAALHTVYGTSMYPRIQPGQVIIVNRYAYLFTQPEIDDVLVFIQPDSNRLMIKRVSAIADGPVYYVTGDNRRESLDSRHFGVLTRDAIIGRVELLGEQRER